MQDQTHAKVLDARYRGLESLAIFPAVLRDEGVYAILSDIVCRSYAKFLGRRGAEFVSEYLGALTSLPSSCSTGQIQEVVLGARLSFDHRGLASYYHNVFRWANLHASIDLVGADRFAGRVADIGTHDNMLGRVLLELAPKVTHIIGVDLEKAPWAVSDSRLEFRVQRDPRRIPVNSAEVDAVVLRYALHHMRFAEQVDILGEVRRILKPGGTVFIFENTYSTVIAPTFACGAVHQRILDLGSQPRIRLLLAALDTFSQGIKAKHGPFPYSFRTMEEWQQLFAQLNLDSFETHYYGLPMVDLHQAPLGVFVLTKG